MKLRSHLAGNCANEAANNPPSMVRADAVFTTKRRSRNAAGIESCAQISHLGIADLGVGMIVAASDRLGMPEESVSFPCGSLLGMGVHSVTIPGRHHSLPGCVSRVISRRAEKEMVRIQAERIVSAGAVMADEEAFGNGPVPHFPRDTMGIVASAANAEGTIAGGRLSGGPKPAPIRTALLIDLRPKTPLGFFADTLMGHLMTSMLGLRMPRLGLVTQRRGFSLPQFYHERGNV